MPLHVITKLIFECDTCGMTVKVAACEDECFKKMREYGFHRRVRTREAEHELECQFCRKKRLDSELADCAPNDPPF